MKTIVSMQEMQSIYLFLEFVNGKIPLPEWEELDTLLTEFEKEYVKEEDDSRSD